MILPSKLRKSLVQRRPEIQRSSSNTESHELPVGVDVEKDDKDMAWHSMFRQRLSDPQRLKLHPSPVNACVLSAKNAVGSIVHLYSVHKDGYIKVGFLILKPFLTYLLSFHKMIHYSN